MLDALIEAPEWVKTIFAPITVTMALLLLLVILAVSQLERSTSDLEAR